VITLDGHTLDYFGLMALKGHSNPTPATRDKSLVIPGKHGAWDFGADMDIIQFNFPMAFFGEDRKAVQKRIRDFTAFLFDSKGKPRTFTMAFDYEPEKYYYVRYSGQIKPERLFGMGTFDLPLTAFDPVAYASLNTYDPEEMYYFDAGLQYDSGLMYGNPQGFQWTYSRHRSGMYNYSYYQTGFNCIINGVVINPRITNETTGESIAVSGAFAEHDQIIIDSERKSIYKLSAEITEDYFLSPNFIFRYRSELKQGNLLPYYSGDFFNLTSGDNSLLFEGGLPGATVEYYWKHKFL
jgi:phage-related protein